MGSELSEHVALVTGGVRGIGLAIGEALMAEGARVAAGFSRNGPAAEAFVERYGDMGATVHQGTIEDHVDCERVVSEVIDHHGRLDILVNNAGITMDRTVRKMAPEEWDHVLRVNLNGVFYMSRAAIPHMIDRGYGRILNISSVVGERGNIGQANYAASKSGQFGLTMTLALELANKGVTVNCVAPGFIETDMTAELAERAAEHIPARRAGKPEDVAAAVRFLASDDAGYVTGTTLYVDGGMSA